MKKKIVITGGLGYIGTELSNIYAGEAWFHEVIVIDKEFFSARVDELRNWKIKFYQGDILDKNFINSILKKSDIVHHLAGITNVAYVKDDINIERDRLIEKTAIDGTMNIINAVDKNCKILFPSSHVVFDGLEKKIENLSEFSKPKPQLKYSSSKLRNEHDIIKSKRKYNIFRLGSAYGFSGDRTRINIMPNLFSKITSQNGSIKLFGGGKQLKSLVSVKDIARCFKYFEENNFDNEIFNLSNENLTVKAVSKICKKYNKNLKLVSTKDKIPNLGYTLSNKKIKKYGFKFNYSLEQSIKEMINRWSYKKSFNENELVLNATHPYKDKRGKILNFELPEAVNLIGLIDSKKGTIRANHYHPIQEQKCLVTKGQFISILKDLKEKNSIIETQLVKENQITITKPNVAHSMIFTENTQFLNLVRGEREHENYGVTHTLPYKLADEKFKKMLLSGYKIHCRVCNSNELTRAISLGMMPLANNLSTKKNLNCLKFPLELNFCKKCLNAQLSYVVNPKTLFNNYLYLSSTSNSFINHFEKAAKKYISLFKLKKSSNILDIGSNDGIALKPFINLGFKNVLGVEPAKNISKLAIKNGINTVNSYFNKKILKRIKKKYDLILASNVFAHSDQIDEISTVMKKILSKQGTIVIEIQYFLNTLKDQTFDNIYHEHVNYWSLISLNKYFSNFNLNLYNCEKINTHGGSLRIFITKDLNKQKSTNFKKQINIEKKNINNIEIQKFRDKIFIQKENVLKNFILLKKKYKKIYCYGAPAKATTLINYFGIKNFISAAVDDNELKSNKYIPGTEIKILKKNIIKIDKNNDCIVVFAWNFFNEIKNSNKKLCKNFFNIRKLTKTI